MNIHDLGPTSWPSASCLGALMNINEAPINIHDPPPSGFPGLVMHINELS
jgi:hypothetical protein